MSCGNQVVHIHAQINLVKVYRFEDVNVHFRSMFLIPDVHVLYLAMYMERLSLKTKRSTTITSTMLSKNNLLDKIYNSPEFAFGGVRA